MSKLDALLVVPPLLKYTAGPLLGPAMLVGAARRGGLAAEVLDLNAAWIAAHWPVGVEETPSGFTGDHDKPGRVLTELQARFSARLSEIVEVDGARAGRDPWQTLTASFEAVDAAALAFASSADGAWARERLATRPAPAVVGVSVMFSGQVVWALAISVLAKTLWPAARVVWGGAHVSALRNPLAADPRYGRRVEGFVFGYAERTFVDLVRAAREGGPLPAEVVAAGSGAVASAREDAGVTPVFEDLEAYGRPRLTLPVQSSRGCRYGQCRFCTHPAIEGAPRDLALEPVEAVVRQAESVGAQVSFKDALLAPARLEALAGLIAGRVKWSGCTKLDRRLLPLLPTLAAAGLDTLEFGLESAVPGTQRLIRKRQSRELFLATLDAAAGAGVKLVVNYITGFPGEDPVEARRELVRVQADLAEREPRLMAQIEPNTFELERLAPLAVQAAAHGIEVVHEWPWASVLDWRPRPADVFTEAGLPFPPRPNEGHAFTRWDETGKLVPRNSANLERPFQSSEGASSASPGVERRSTRLARTVPESGGGRR